MKPNDTANPTHDLDRRLTILLATKAPFVSGAEIAGERLALGLGALGNRVVVAVGTAGEALERYRAVGLDAVYSPICHTSKWGWPRYYLARRGLQKLIGRLRPDIIHSNDLPTHQIVSDAAKGSGVPRICHHRFIYPGPALDWLNKYGAELHIAISHAVRNQLCSSSTRLAAENWTTIHDGIPILEFPSDRDRAAARVRCGLPADRVIAIFAGQIVECKGVADLLQAWALLPGELRDRAELVCVGEDRQTAGQYRQRMQQLAESLGIRAKFPGFVSDVGTWQMASSIAVVPSHIEPLGLVSLEAMTYGLPVVGTAVGGIPEVVVDGRTGLLVPPHSPEKLAIALHRLIADADERARFGHEGRKRSKEQFSIESHVRAIVEAYRRLKAEPKKS